MLIAIVPRRNMIEPAAHMQTSASLGWSAANAEVLVRVRSNRCSRAGKLTRSGSEWRWEKQASRSQVLAAGRGPLAVPGGGHAAPGRGRR
jgi:hypothetical protein